MTKRKTHKTYVPEVAVINSDIEITGIYINQRTKIECRYKKCNTVLNLRPDSLLRGQSCKKCADTATSKTHDQYVLDVAIKFPNIKVHGKYIGNKKKDRT